MYLVYYRQCLRTPHVRSKLHATAQTKEDHLSEHYEFNWCLRSPLGGRLLMHIGTQDNYDVLKTRCEDGGRHIRTSNRSRNMKIGSAILNSMYGRSPSTGGAPTGERQPACKREGLFRQGCHRQAPGTTTGTTSFTRREHTWCGVLCCHCSSPPRGDRPTSGAAAPEGGPTKKMDRLSESRHPKGSSHKKLHNSGQPPPPIPPGSCCDYNKNPPPRQLCYISLRILHQKRSGSWVLAAF